MGLFDFFKRNNAVVGYGSSPEAALADARDNLPVTGQNLYGVYREQQSKVGAEGSEIKFSATIEYLLNDEGKKQLGLSTQPGPGSARLPDFSRLDRI